MTQRTESLVTTLQIDGSDGERYIARIEGTDVDLQVQSNVTYASVRLPLSILPGFLAFLGEVAEDPAAVLPEPEPAPEGDGAVVPEDGELTA
ncbi:hypothetical protein SEA_CLEARASMUD_43 [Microbacterium phage ClearAsMud]|uniref:Uncharacterized protein n=1 Tax=Microbacterium phage ClearAsMud TaxID=2743404 RepID=A0A7G9A0W4_9CAUD|nr:hypothetical protein QDA07_gp43 [Microbacterium phage ClearAsMud]QNL30253.1 hypothetical protein SEA_CLEARASMUD_43 [Microbacterium phage ClearAsMud]